jgi:hypothetical protein
MSGSWGEAIIKWSLWLAGMLALTTWLNRSRKTSAQRC